MTRGEQDAVNIQTEEGRLRGAGGLDWMGVVAGPETSRRRQSSCGREGSLRNKKKKNEKTGADLFTRGKKKDLFSSEGKHKERQGSGKRNGEWDKSSCVVSKTSGGFKQPERGKDSTVGAGIKKKKKECGLKYWEKLLSGEIKGTVKKRAREKSIRGKKGNSPPSTESEIPGTGDGYSNRKK